MKRKRGPGGRRGAFRIKDHDGVHKMMPYIMKNRCDSTVLFTMDIDMEPLRKFGARTKREGWHINTFIIVLVSMVRTIFDYPMINRYIIGRRLYQKNYVDLSFVVKEDMSFDGKDINVIVPFEMNETPGEIREKIIDGIAKARAGFDEGDNTINTIMKLPRFLLKGFFRFLTFLDYHGKFPNSLAEFDPMRSSLFISNVGSIDVDMCYHHLYEWGTTSIFSTVGKVKKRPMCRPGGAVEARDAITICFTIDERICDGYYISRVINHLRKYLENPETIFDMVSENEKDLNVKGAES